MSQRLRGLVLIIMSSRFRGAISGRKWRRSQPASGRVAGVVGRAPTAARNCQRQLQNGRTRGSCLSPMRTEMPSDRLVQLVLGDPPGRQAVIPIVAPLPPDERSIRRRHSGVTPNAAIAAIELYDGEVRMCRSGGREAERQHADCESKSLHCTPMLRLLPPAQLLAGGSTRHELPDERFAPMRPHRVVFL